MASNGKSMRIVELRAENIKRLKAVHIKPNGNIVQITGRNAQGKTSVLDAIWYALCGRAKCDRPIREGQAKAEVEVNLGELIVKRKWNLSGNSYLAVESPEGAQFKSPQNILDKLVGELTFDPLAFTRMDSKAQVEALKAATGLNFDDLDRRKTEAFVERTQVNRDLKKIEGQIAGMPDIEAPEQPVSVSELLAELGKAERKKARHDQLISEYRSVEEEKASLIVTIERLQQSLAQTRKDLEQTTKKAEEIKKAAAEIEDPVIEIEAIKTRLQGVEEINQRIRAKQQRVEKDKEFQSLREKSTGLTRIIEDCESQKRDELEKARMPVEGLGFGPEGVTYEGIPFSQSSSAEQLRVSVAMGLAMNPRLRVMLIRDGSLLDQENLEQLALIAQEHDAQIWIERVSDGAPVGVVIEDGSVVGQEINETAAQ